MMTLLPVMTCNQQTMMAENCINTFYYLVFSHLLLIYLKIIIKIRNNNNMKIVLNAHVYCFFCFCFFQYGSFY